MKLWILFGVTALSFLGSLGYILLSLPHEATQGVVQKIFFFHVPSAFALYVHLILGALLSLIYLFDRRKILDDWARSLMNSALVFTLIVLCSGPVWAKPIWGVYWTWDPRLTTTFIVLIMLIGYVCVRHLYTGTRSAMIGAVIALLAVLDIPLIHYSVTLWRGVHPSVLRNPDGLPSSYQTGLELMILSMFLWGALMTVLFYKVRKLQNLIEATKGETVL